MIPPASAARVRDLLREAEAVSLAAEDLPDAIAETERLRAIYEARLLTSCSAVRSELAPACPPERLLTAPEVAERLGVTLDWVYRHADRLPFRVSLGDRFLRFSESGLNRYIRVREGK